MVLYSERIVVGKGKDIERVLKPIITEDAGSVRGESTTKRKTWKWFGGKVHGTWGTPGNGKYWKRQLNKAERRAWKNDVAGRKKPDRGLSGHRGTVNWKNT